MREVDDVHQAENDGQAQRQQGIERAIDEAQQKLSEKRLRRYADQIEHVAPASTRRPPRSLVLCRFAILMPGLAIGATPPNVSLRAIVACRLTRRDRPSASPYSPPAPSWGSCRLPGRAPPRNGGPQRWRRSGSFAPPAGW